MKRFPILLLSMSISLSMSLLISGCFYHATQIELGPSSNAGTELSPSEIARATEIVAGIMSERGLLPSTSDVEHLSRTEDEWEEFMLAAYWSSSAATTDHRVVVSVLLHKETNRYSVLVRDLDSAAASDFTNSLEKSLTDAFAKEFPSQTIRVDRKTVGPALGP